MKPIRAGHLGALTAALAAALLAAAALAASPAAAPRNNYITHNLVSDQAGNGDHVDTNLVNAWGLASLSGSPWWVADNGTDLATVYTADGAASQLARR